MHNKLFVYCGIIQAILLKTYEPNASNLSFFAWIVVSHNSIIWAIYSVDASKFPWFCKIKSPFIISYRFVCVLFFSSFLSWWNKTFQSCIFFVRLPVDLLLIVALLLYYQNNHLSMIPRYINFISNEESCKLLQAHPFWEFETCPVVRMSLK